MATQRRRRARNIPGPTQDFIRHQHLVVGWTPAQIHKELEKRSDLEWVSQRTVQRFVRDMGGSGPLWTIHPDIDPDEAHIVMELLEWKRRQGADPPTIPASIAPWAVVMLRVRPKLPLGYVLFFAPFYKQAAEEGDQDALVALTAGLASAPDDLDPDMFTTDWRRRGLESINAETWNAAMIAAKPKDKG